MDAVDTKCFVQPLQRQRIVPLSMIYASVMRCEMGSAGRSGVMHMQRTHVLQRAAVQPLELVSPWQQYGCRHTMGAALQCGVSRMH